MPIIRLEKHSSSLIFDAVKKMCQDHSFEYNEDASDTEIGKLKKEFKLNFNQVDNSSRSNNQNLRVRATVEITLFHNAEGRTDEIKKIALDDAEDLIFEIERFSPDGDKFKDIKNIITVTDLLRFLTEPTKVGDDSRLRTIIIYEIEYKIRNPIA